MSWTAEALAPRLCLADLAAERGRWDEVERCLDGIAPEELSGPRGCHVHHLWGLARLHAGDPGRARAHFAALAALGPRECDVQWNLDLVRALLDPPETAPEPGASALRRLVLACRFADACFERADWAAARDALEIPPVHDRLEVQSAARLAEAHLALEPSTPLGRYRKAVALARYAHIDPARRGLCSEIPGLGWDTRPPPTSPGRSPPRRFARCAPRAGRAARRSEPGSPVARRSCAGRARARTCSTCPGRIPISQLRALEHVEREAAGRELLARFMVRGHWRRANPSWLDQRVRWIEPFWKGPELAAIVDKEYRLKL